MIGKAQKGGWRVFWSLLLLNTSNHHCVLARGKSLDTALFDLRNGAKCRGAAVVKESKEFSSRKAFCEGLYVDMELLGCCV